MNRVLYNEQYEKAVIGFMLNDNSLIDVIKGRLPAEAFYNITLRNIYQTVIKQWEADKCANILTVSSAFPNLTPARISELTDIGSSENWEFYITKLQKCHLARTITSDLSEIMRGLSEETAMNVVDELSGKVSNYLKYEGNKGNSVQDLCMSIPNEIQKAHEEQKPLLGYDCGWSQLNDITDGFQDGKLYVIGARPSIGKTAFAMNLLANFCRRGIPCTAFSLEMSARMLFYRMLSVESKLPMTQLLKGDCLSYQDGLRKLGIGFTNLYKFPLNIMDTDIDREQQIYSRIRYEAKINGTKVFMIDHLGLIESSDRSVQRYEQVGRMTKTLAKLSKELNVVIILLCQMGREAEGKKPSMNLLRESGNIEQDADVIMFLYRERDMEETQIPTEVIVEKNRDGRLGVAKMLFLSTYTKFVEDVSAKHEEEVA